MSEERRGAPRARISGARVTYESAIGGDRVEADALNLGRGGLFVLTDRPLAVGKRIALEIQVAGELVPWAALGRVIWSRERSDSERRPAGMGVKLIDVEDDVLETIERLVEGRASELGDIPVDEEVPAAEVVTSPIVTVTPARERTILGVGLAPPGAEAAPPTPKPSDTPTPSPPAEPIVLREPLRPRDARETGAPFDLVQKETTPSTTPGARRPASDSNPAQRTTSPPQRAFASSRPSESPPAAPKRRGGQWTVVFLLIVVAAAAAYWVLGGDPEKLMRPSEPGAAPVERPVLPPPVPTPVEPASVTAPTAERPPTSASTVAPPSGAAPPPPIAPAASAPRRPATGYPSPYPVTVPSPPGHGPGTAADGGRRSATEENPY